MNKIWRAVAIGLLLAGPVGAVDEPALEALRAAAARGDAAAQYEMGVLYEFGFNLPDNLPAALAWYMAAADQGNAQALKRRDLVQGQLPAAAVEEAQRLRAEIASAAPTRPVAPVPAAAEPPATPPPASDTPVVAVPEPKADEPK
jgi:localization factor PodJL